MIQNKLFVGELPQDLLNDDFKAMFTQFGTIIEATIVRDRNTNVSKRFGYVTFLNNEDALKAIEVMDQQVIEGKKRLVTFAKPGT